MMKQAIILAAGEGSRLRPFTANKPKSMLYIAGKPVLQYVIEALAQSGIRNLVLVVGYRRQQIYDYFGSGEQFGVGITYVTQEKQLGTANALAQARDVAENEFLVLAGDKLIEAGTISRFVDAAPETALVIRIGDPQRHGTVDIEGGLIKGIVEQAAEPKSNLISTRIYALSREVFDYLGSELVISAALNKMIAAGKNVRAQETGGPWLDITYPWDILSLNALVLDKVKPTLSGFIEKGVYMKGPVAIGRDSIIRANSTISGPVVIGSGCEIGPNACILPATSIGDNVVIAPFSMVQNCVIGNDVKINPGSTVQDSVIDRGSMVGVNFTAGSGEAVVQVGSEHHSVKMGAMLGEGCNIGNCVVAQPGVIVGNYIQVQSLKVIGGRLPDKSLVI